MLSDTHIVRVVQPLGRLTFVHYPEPACDGWAAHCVELDIGGQGTDRRTATDDLQASIETYVLHYLENDEAVPIRDAPEELRSIQEREVFMLLWIRLRVKNTQRREVVFSSLPPERFSADLVPA